MIPQEVSESSMIEVCRYSQANLKRLFTEYSDGSSSGVEGKLHTVFFHDYFKELCAKTIVVESPYTDADYLDDFAHYYLRCFRHIKKTTTRLHFFTLTMGTERLEMILSGEAGEAATERLRKSYLGFIVVKPLVRTIIGRTCLKTYSNAQGVRHYPAIRTYDVNFFGVPLSVESLAFQEQDSVVAACATSALWSAFHATGKLFQHAIPSPSSITELATQHGSLSRRRFPNEGLTPEQMADAVSAVGLEPEIVNASSSFLLRAAIRAYLSIGIPPVLVGHLVDTYGLNAEGDPSFVYPSVGLHAVAVAGYAQGSDYCDGERLPLVSSGMTKLYVHDDQVGPFAKMQFEETGLIVEMASGEVRELPVIGTHWIMRDSVPYNRSVKFAPIILLLPLYSKIRIPIEKVIGTVWCLHEILKLLRNGGFLLSTGDLRWDLRLATVNGLKTEYQRGPTRNSDAVRLLLKPFPRFVWRAIAFDGDLRMFELLFDATDIEQTGFCFDLVSWDGATIELVSELCRQGLFTEEAHDEGGELLEWLARRRP